MFPINTKVRNRARRKTVLIYLSLFLSTSTFCSANDPIKQVESQNYGTSNILQCEPIPEVNFPGGRVILSFDGNIHDDDDIVALPFAAGLWWAAGLQDKVVQIEYNNHDCYIGRSIENDGVGPGVGADSENMITSVEGVITRFGYNPAIFYNFETQGTASASKMALEIEKSTAANPLWIIAGGPMESVWRGLNQATKGYDHVTLISHSLWNELHEDCAGAHNWATIKNQFLSKGVYFVGSCGGSECDLPTGLNDQNAGFASPLESNWIWMKNSSHEYNRWIFSRNPFSDKFDPSDAGMSYFLISGGPFNGGNKRSNHDDAEKLMENACPVIPESGGQNIVPDISFKTPIDGQEIRAGKKIPVEANATDIDGNIVGVTLYVNDELVRREGIPPYLWADTNQDPLLQDVQAGQYELTIIAEDNGGAKTSETIKVVVKDTPLGINSDFNDIGNLSAIQLESNPVKNKLLTIIKNEKNNTQKLKIINLSGIVLKEITLNDERITVDVSNLAAGIYLLASKTDSNTFVIE